MDSRAGWILYLTLLLAWVAFVVNRRMRAERPADPAAATERNRNLILFVVAWAVILLAIAIGWRLFHRG